MPFHYRIQPELSLIYYAGFGACAGKDMAEAEQAAARDPQRRPGMRILIDTLRVEDFEFTVDDLKGWIKLNQSLAAQGREPEQTAFLVRHEQDALLNEAYALMAAPFVQVKLGTFWTLVDAVTWLGLKEHLAEITALQTALRQAQA